MRSILFLFFVLIPVTVLSQKCPTFQSVIALRPSVTSLNFSYAVVADGKYYLFEFQNFRRNFQNLQPTGLMPEGFEDCRLITVVDRSDCNDSQYYLIAIKTLRLSSFRAERSPGVQTSYSTLDLMNFGPKTQWSEPKPLSEHPLFANDPYIKLFSQFDPDVEIEDFVHTLFYWEQTQTHFVVTKPLRMSSSEAIKSSSLRYYSIDAQRVCEHNYSYSKRPESLSLALNTVLEPLNLCFFSHSTGISDSLLYCIGGQSFQANAIITLFQNGSVRTESVGDPKQMPTIDRLRVLGGLCSEEKASPDGEFGEKDRIRVRIEQIRIGVVGEPQSEVIHKSQPDTSEPIRDLSMPSIKGMESTSEKPSEDDSSPTFIIVLICLAIFVVLMVGILIIAARRQQQMAKM